MVQQCVDELPTPGEVLDEARIEARIDPPQPRGSIRQKVNAEYLSLREPLPSRLCHGFSRAAVPCPCRHERDEDTDIRRVFDPSSSLRVEP
jgi:hypothetical protein